MQSKLCVGAVSRRVVEVAARLQVPQIVASRRQVDTSKGYTGMTQWELVDLVRNLSKGQTAVVRDHGGPLQGWGGDDGVASLDADVTAGFDGLHLDVCRLSVQDREPALFELAKRYRNHPHLEVGGEHDAWLHNIDLYWAAHNAGARPKWIVAEAGTFVWAERQRPVMEPLTSVVVQSLEAHRHGLRLKAHNADFMLRSRSEVISVVDAYNLAPELAVVELDALLMVLPCSRGTALLEQGYLLAEWKRWFDEDQGTWFERARCGARYILEDPAIREITKLDAASEEFVRRRIEHAIKNG